MNKAIDLEGSIPTTEPAYHVLGKGKHRVAGIYIRFRKGGFYKVQRIRLTHTGVKPESV
jgi:hypothetical protein